MSVTASPALITASCAAATNDRPAGNRRNSDVCDKNTRRGGGSPGMTHSIPALTQREDANSLADITGTGAPQLEGHFVDRDQVARIRVIIERRAAPHGQMRSTPADVYPTVVLPADYPAAETASARSCNRRYSPSAPITPSTPASRPRSPGPWGDRSTAAPRSPQRPHTRVFAGHMT